MTATCLDNPAALRTSGIKDEDGSKCSGHAKKIWPKIVQC